MRTAVKGKFVSTLSLIILVSFAPQFAATQDAANSVHQRTFWAESPVQVAYPPLARAARITGDVQLRVQVRPDGTVSSAEVVSGSPMLQESALNSVRKATFHCWPVCTDTTTATVITYTYGLREGDCCCNSVRQRSWKCLNLWKCGSRTKYPLPTQPPTIGTAQNRIIILADVICVETESADARTPGAN